MTPGMSRRTFVRKSVLASAGAALVVGSAGKGGVAKAAEDALPRGKIGELEISRLLLGGNLLTHYTHSRDLKYVYSLARHYNTEEKILQTMATAEEHGINTLVIHTAKNVMKLLKRYRHKEGGKIQWIICTTAPMEDGLAKFNQAVQQLVDDGVDAVYIWGVRGDQLVKDGRVDLIGKAVDAVKAHGIPCGVGGHLMEVVVECEKEKIDTDFYVKTLHHHDYPSAKLNFDSMWCNKPEELSELMKGVEKPWIAFKVMAAGAIPPKSAFQYAFDKGGDFVLAGMFDFEIAEDVRIAKEALSSVNRARPWRA